jgi:CubicO group peptidase (beta-lactamase class C family)
VTRCHRCFAQKKACHDTGMGMRELFRDEVVPPLNTDGVHLGRPPAGSPTKVAQILLPQNGRPNPVIDFVAPKVAGLPFSGALGAMYFPGVMSFVQGDIPFLDGEVPAPNGVVTGRGLAKMYAAIANGGVIDGQHFLSAELANGLIGKPKMRPDLNMLMPMPFHLGYHESPIPGLMKGFGHGNGFRHGFVRGYGAPVAQGDRHRAQQWCDCSAAIRRDVPRG